MHTKRLRLRQRKGQAARRSRLAPVGWGRSWGRRKQHNDTGTMTMFLNGAWKRKTTRHFFLSIMSVFTNSWKAYFLETNLEHIFRQPKPGEKGDAVYLIFSSSSWSWKSASNKHSPLLFPQLSFHFMSVFLNLVTNKKRNWYKSMISNRRQKQSQI